VATLGRAIAQIQTFAVVAQLQCLPLSLTHPAYNWSVSAVSHALCTMRVANILL
jgi:hypothetical protein